MGSVYASAADVIAFGRSLSAAETETAETLLEAASAKLRILAGKYGFDLDTIVSGSEDYALAVKQAVVQAVIRALNASSGSDMGAIQGSQAALGYSVSYTFQNPGQSLYFLRNELKDLGFLKQRYGVIDFYGMDQGDDS